jgi:hypothetical protein
MDKVRRPIDSLSNQFLKENKYSQYFIRSVNGEFISGVDKYNGIVLHLIAEAKFRFKETR